MVTDEKLQAWWESLTEAQRVDAFTFTRSSTPPDWLTPSLLQAGLPSVSAWWFESQPDEVVTSKPYFLLDFIAKQR